MVIDDAQRRLELARLLRSRRAAIQPAAAGLPSTGRRRTAGLRREEVAALAGLSATLYTWLEQARPVPVSESALTRIAGALGCSAEQTQLILTLLSGHDSTSDGGRFVSATCREHLDDIIRRQDPCPAFLLGARWEALTQNRAARRVFGDWSEVPAAERDIPTLLFTYPRYRTLFRDWPTHARRVVGEFQLSMALRSNDPQVSAMIERLRRGSAEFAEWWVEYPVQHRRGYTVDLDHPDLGRLALHSVPMSPPDESGLRVIICLPADDATEAIFQSMQ